MIIDAIASSRQARRIQNAGPGFAVAWLVLCLALGSCGEHKEEMPVIPPPTSPLSRTVIGFGVINVSYTHITADPAEGGFASGYLRRGSLVQVMERRTVKKNDLIESWVLVQGNYRGWLRESAVDIYDNEGRARTAAESMSR
jgi:hypothetical protein